MEEHSSMITLTIASTSITVQSKPRSTAALEWTIWVGAGLCTTTIVIVALIDICWRKKDIINTSSLSYKRMYVCIPLQPVPSLANWNPLLQLHVKEPWLLAQFWTHPPLLVLHSLMSGEKKQPPVIKIYKSSDELMQCTTRSVLPLQLIPSLANWNPFLQLHVKEPWLLAQLWAHPPLLVLHSLMSGGGKFKH